MEKSETYLDLRKNTVYGWETPKDLILVEALREGIKQGDKIPRVEVIYLQEEEYCLDRSSKNGGHYRAIAHLLEGALLSVKINFLSPLDNSTWITYKKEINGGRMFPINTIPLIDPRTFKKGSENWKLWKESYQDHLAKGNWRIKEIAKKFNLTELLK